MNKQDKKFTLQDWIDKLATRVINLEEVVEYQLQHKTMNKDYYLVLEATRPNYSISDIKYYKNDIKIYSYVKNKYFEYKPSFIELSMDNWELINEDWYNKHMQNVAIKNYSY